MIRGLYTAASGLLSNLRQQEAVANNLANAQTTGYKEDTAANESFQRVLAERVGNAPVPVPLTFRHRIGPVGTGAFQAERKPFLKQGVTTRTDLPLDLAIMGPGFFATQTPEGDTLYTRGGHFTKSDAGQLVTEDGRLVLGVDGAPINVEGAQVVVQRNGAVIVDGVEAGTVALYDFDPDALTRADGSSFAADPADGTLLEAGREPRFEQGALETSNTELGEETTRLMSTARQFEANQRLFKELSENLQRAVNDVGRVG